ncbi:MAG TPA: aldo/keto reductase, partial [Steroidobacteraceae bacterium]|nr:aldo/keto reductase [Steroidobacteraceae bacterium]
ASPDGGTVAAFSDPRISRRELLQTGVMAGVGAMLSRALPAAGVAALPLIVKQIPRTGEALPVMGIGTNAFNDPNNTVLRDVLQRMQQLGGTVIDTAAMYGQSEAVIGAALAQLGLRSRMFLATKFNAAGVFSRDPAGSLSFERSLMRLQTDHVDLLFAHFLDSVEPLMPLMQQLKQAGKTRYIGITSVDVDQHPRLIEYMRRYPIDFVQVDYSLTNREAATSVFPVAMERRIAVMVAVPLGGRRGSLLAQAAGHELPGWAGDMDVSSWSQFCLKYVVSHPAVTCAIPGSSKLQHIEDNQAAGHGRVPDAAMRRRMEQFWDRI